MTTTRDNEKIIALLASIDEKLETLVAAEIANMQANEMMLKAFEGKTTAEKTEAFARQRLLGGDGSRPRGR